MKHNLIPFLLFLITLLSCRYDNSREFAHALGLQGEEREEALHGIVKKGDSPWNREALLLLTDISYEDDVIFRKMKSIYQQGDRDGEFLTLLFRHSWNRGEGDYLLQIHTVDTPAYLEKLYSEILHDHGWSALEIAETEDLDLLTEIYQLSLIGADGLFEDSQAPLLLDLRRALWQREYGEARVAYEQLYRSTPTLAFNPQVLYRCWYALSLQSNWKDLLQEIKVMEEHPQRSFAIGRIYRHHENYMEAQQWFAKSPEGDRSLWYYLDSLFKEDLSLGAQGVMDHFHRMEDLNYFDDKLGQCLQYLIAQRKWTHILRITDGLALQERSPIVGRFAWVSARILIHDLIQSEKKAEDFYNLAMESDPLGWYGFLSAWQLGHSGENLLNPLSRDNLDYLQDIQEAMGPNQKDADPLWASPDGVFIGLYYSGWLEEASQYYELAQSRMVGPGLPLRIQQLHAQGNHYSAIHLGLKDRRKNDFQESMLTLMHNHPPAYQEEIQYWGGYYGIDPWLLSGLIRTESAYHRSIVSSAGAVGLTQLMEATAWEQASQLGLGEVDLEDPDTNLQLSGRYILWLKRRPYLNNLGDLLAAYNGGPGNLQRWKTQYRNLPPELFWEVLPYRQTRDYIGKVFTAALYYSYLYGERSPEECLNLWLPELQS